MDGTETGVDMQPPDEIEIVSSAERSFTDKEIGGFHALTKDPEQQRWDPGEEELDLPDLTLFFREILPARPLQAIFLAKTGDEVVGMSGLFVHREGEAEGVAKLGFGVLGPWQEKGVARRLIEAALQHGREKGLKRVLADVLPHNLRAIRLLNAAGFAISTPEEPAVEHQTMAVFELRI